MSADARNAENVDRIVRELAEAPGNVKLDALFAALDAAAAETWWPRDADYAASALHQAALGCASPSRRNRLLEHAAERAGQYARWASNTAEHDARMHHVREIEADRVIAR